MYIQAQFKTKQIAVLHTILSEVNQASNNNNDNDNDNKVSPHSNNLDGFNQDPIG